MDRKIFNQNIKKIAVPITIQSMLQAVVGLVDQIMIGHLGSTSIAGIGIAGKFISLFGVTITALVAVAGILIAQYKGKQSKEGINKSFFSNLYFALLVAVVFVVLSLIWPRGIMSLYSEDGATIHQAVDYLRIMAIGFVPQTITLMLSALLRNMDAAKYATIASGTCVIANTILNYIFIFGVGVIPEMQVVGAALATVLARMIELAIAFAFYKKLKQEKGIHLQFVFAFEKEFIKKIFSVLAPILVCEFLWSLGENIYAIIYGHIGTDALAAMILTYPIQGIATGLLSGVSASAAIIVGESLGAGKNDKAYREGKEFLKITTFIAVFIGIFVVLFASHYVKLFNVNDLTKDTTIHILYSYALVFWAKVINMVLGGGVLRSGGQTKYIMIIDIVGTWLIGVPLGYFMAYVLKLPIYSVYLVLSVEEYVRVLLELYIFRSRRWMKNMAD